METVGEDLVLLGIRANGTIGVAAKLRFGLSGAELIRLAAMRRVDIERGRIVVLDPAPTGDALLDDALASMRGRGRPPTAKNWVARNRAGLTKRYLDRLVAAGTIRLERRKALGLIPVDRWIVADAGRLAQAKARLDAIAYGSGGVSAEQAALAGLASAIGLARLQYPGSADRAAIAAATDAAISASIDAATSAATDAAQHAGSGGHGGGHH
ncbi:MAG TPA: GPP34 family phosphoprotein [Streptosporangiaceae bacterium]|nr:GPP34 family phosphoprotein [Streptosporangiaceae bacterium]